MNTYKVTFKTPDFVILTGTSKQDIADQVMDFIDTSAEIDEIELVLGKEENENDKIKN